MADDVCALPLDAKARQAFRRRLLKWYAQHARDLPWRRSRDPYRVWLSEVMLQQTTVAMAGPHFERFTQALPTLQTLADADEQQVLRLWEGLGYYRRARALHATAKRIVADHGGHLPRDVPTLMKLPGIGRYTAGAIVSQAFDLPAPILEANTIRLFSRLMAYEGDPAKSAGQQLLWRAAEELVPRTGAAQFNQALMELGALVCTPEAPRCDACPVVAHCAAFRTGRQLEIPRLAARVSPTALREAAVAVQKNGAVLMRQCGADERWAGLWDFPRFRLEAKAPSAVRQELVAGVRTQTGVTVAPGGQLTTLKHAVTRYRITLECYRAAFVGGRVRSTAEAPVRWVRTRQLTELPLSVTGRKLAALLM